MSANEIQTVATAASAATETTTDIATDDRDVFARATPADAGSEEDSDRVCLDILSREPVLRFAENTESGALGTVSVDPSTGLATPLTTGISPLDLTRDILASGGDIVLADRPILRAHPAVGDEPGHTDVVDPRTGEVVNRVAENDFFDLDVAIREFTRKALVDKSA